MPIDAKRSHAVFQRLEQNLVKLSSKPRTEDIHRFRTGTRRVQILLGELAPKLDRNQKKLLKLLSRLRRRAGKVRDLDVQLAALRSLKVGREARRKTQLVSHLIELRRRQEKKLRKAVDPDTVREIRKRLERADKNFHPEASRDPLIAAKKMLQRIDRDAPVTEPLLHQYRILSKRARYAAEFAGDTAEARRFTAQLKHIQDALGDWHDWLTLTQTATAQLGDLRESVLVAELHNVTGAKFRHAVTVLSHMRANLAAEKISTAQAPPRTPAEAVRKAASAA